MSGFDNAGSDELFFAGTTVKSNFLCGIGYGDPEGLFERLPRLSFEEACQILWEPARPEVLDDLTRFTSAIRGRLPQP